MSYVRNRGFMKDMNRADLLDTFIAELTAIRNNIGEDGETILGIKVGERMKKYTQAEFDAIERDEYGYKHLPSGDWTGVDFGGQDKLIFGDGCTLGNWCELEAGRVDNSAFFFASNIGSENRTAYAYCNTETGEIFVRAGCWFSDLTAFIERVKSVHGGTQHEVDYLAFAEFAKVRFARYQAKEAKRDATD